MSDQEDSTNNANSLELDWEHLHEISDGDADFEIELLQMFVEDAQTHIDEVKEAVEQNDWQKLGREAHHLKGASANVGAKPMQLAAEKLEQMVHQQQAGFSDILSDLETFLHQIEDFVNSK
ncbi:MAG TPA: Hpt domain-containing protein [Oculatellaceae cyanobacterium]